MKDLENPSLDEVLKAYDIHFSEEGHCKDCLYEVKGGFDGSCVVRMTKDLHKYVIMLKEANEELMMRLFRSEQLKWWVQKKYIIKMNITVDLIGEE